MASRVITDGSPINKTVATSNHTMTDNTIEDNTIPPDDDLLSPTYTTPNPSIVEVGHSFTEGERFPIQEYDTDLQSVPQTDITSIRHTDPESIPQTDITSIRHTDPESIHTRQMEESFNYQEHQQEAVEPVPGPVVTFHKVPSGLKSPVANYFSYIKWEGDYRKWKLVRFSTPMDGSCLFHAISNSFFEPYHSEHLNGKHISRAKIVSHLRKELSQKLASNISDESDSPTYYDVLNGGNTSAFAEAVPEFTLSYMQDQLKSSFPIGYGYMEFIGNALDKDIYILEAIRHDIYITDELPLVIKGGRKSIVLYYMNGHYELVGIEREDGTFDTHFSPDHSLIRFLYGRVLELVK